MEGHVCPLLGVLTEKKIVQCKSCELSFIWGTVRPRAWDTASQRALRSCSKEVREEGRCLICFSEGCTCSRAHGWPRLDAGHEE